MNQAAELAGEVFVPRFREQRLNGRKLIVVLEQACVELVHVGKGRHELLDGTRHRRILEKNGRGEEAEDCRPDITFQCLQALLDSPLNKNGYLLIYIRTASNQLIEISPQWKTPLTYLEFESIMATLCLQKVIKAKEANTALLRIIKNDLRSLLPPGCRCIGFEVDGNKVDLNKYAQQICEEQIDSREQKKVKEMARADSFGWKRSAPASNSSPKKLRSAAISQFNAKRELEAENIREGIPIVFCIGAVAKGNPGSKDANELVDETICISKFPLSAAVCCAKACDAFERLWC